MEIFASNNNDMLKQAVLAIREHGIESSPGNSEINTDGTRFIDGVTITVRNPRDRWLSVEGRNSSALAAIGETFWVLAGRNDLAFLSRVLPRAPEFSDDGLTWRGAYGPRIYAHGQLDSVINRLRQNPNSRQAYLTIYDPALDSDEGLAASSQSGEAKTKDMICNLALLFSVINNHLNLTVINRSQDVLWGMSSINFIEFSIIQEVVANILGVNVGVYKLFSNNLHYYNNEVSRKQLSKITEDTKVWTLNPADIVFSGITCQEQVKELFYGITLRCENGRPFEEIEEFLKGYGADCFSLLLDMAYCLWCRMTGNLINMNNVFDLSLIHAICNSPVDKKYVDRKYLQGEVEGAV
ncbi:deoxyuridylate hydroxymethyltransferase [Salmonella phage CRW-SP2]|nr:deoxyuridylate hydroxymethyltransferase [Salmonella phage CRW-SP2]